MSRDSIVNCNYNITQTTAAPTEPQLKEILLCPATLSFEALQQDIHEEWTPGKSGRFLRSELFLQWLEGMYRNLWGTGIMPRAGKTILA
ncbi:hypothetical protein BKA70DRAFT_1562753 [Coprinopsis sp. MPI-PUGE-AT-0042]|nr:hypothetical protein BKA70DRAFT_1562753 [Coprinopsis sp. MPI-PUGE-AT-0042]